jgi:UDP-glucose 4-epimerase
MNVLITGGTGAVGLHIANRLLEKKDNVILYDLFPRELDFIEKEKTKKVKMVEGDVTDLEKLIETIKRYGIEGIIHTAALSYEAICKPSPIKALNVNTGGTLNALEATRLMNLERMLLISTGSVYGYRDRGPVSEETAQQPIGIYSLTKQLSEIVGLQYSRIYGINFLIVRLAVVYGPGQTVPNHAGHS